MLKMSKKSTKDNAQPPQANSSWMVKKSRQTKESNRQKPVSKRQFAAEDFAFQDDLPQEKQKKADGSPQIKKKQRSTDADDVEMKTGEEESPQQRSPLSKLVHKSQSASHTQTQQTATKESHSLLQLNAEDLFVQRPVFNTSNHDGSSEGKVNLHQQQQSSQPSVSNHTLQRAARLKQ